MKRWGSSAVRKNWRLPDWRHRGGQQAGRPRYDTYHLSIKEWGLYELLGIAACGAAAYLFYRNMAAFFLFLPVGILYPFYKKKERKERREEELRVQFKEAILILASSLSAGYAIENAFSASIRELKELYGENGMITEEFSYIAHQMQMNRTVEQLLSDFAARSGIEEIRSFAEIFAVSKRSRGELVSVVTHVVHVISDKIQVKEEILTLTAEKKFEQKIMNLMPFFIVLYIDLSSPGFFTQMYETAAGRIVMTICLIVYLCACLLSGRIMKIEV